MLPSHRDNGHSLFCSLAYSSEFGSDLSVSAPKCGFEKMDVKYGPKFTELDCPEIQTVRQRGRRRRKGRGGGGGGGKSTSGGGKGGVVKAKNASDDGSVEGDDDGDDEEEEEDGFYRVKCRVHANPQPPIANFTWAFFNDSSGL